MDDIYLHFNGYEKVLVNENYNIPTLIYNSKAQTYIGNEVFENVEDPSLINKNFKIDIGRQDPKKSVDYRNYTNADGDKISALRLAELFLNKVLKYTETFLVDNSFAKPKSVLIAEPLVLQNNEEIDKEWLTLYRKNLRSYLERRGFENISFLPEPFAVFQYYKYCKKFAPLNKDEQIVVFVIDFGGGTFDTCIIETTEEGKIKEGAKNSKPLGASSIAKGGNDIDKVILNFILLKYHTAEDVKIKRAYRLTRDVELGRTKYETLNDEQKCFYNNYQKALIKIQNFKEILSNNIRNWELETNITESVSISLPYNFFDVDSEIFDYQLTAIQFKDLFIRFYNDELKKGIKLTLDRGLSVTKKKKPDYILLSGGSSKIGWINEILKNDFHDCLSLTEVVKLDNYKEVVSTGLAVECARKYFNETGDFSDLTYNTINLIINPNDRGIEIPQFKTLSLELKEELNKGVLIPSSTSLRNHFDKKLLWKFKLHSEPKNQISYFFLRNSVDPHDTDNLQNIISTNTSVDTKKFDKYVQIELEIKEDGTTYPNFIFNSKNEKDSIIKGTPFFLDMTYGDVPIKANSYLGIDFGTCNSSVTYISNQHIEKYNEQSEKNTIKLTKDILDKGPFPISYHLAKFQNEFDEVRKAKRFRQLFENTIALLFFITLAELKSVKPNFKLRDIKIIRAAGSLILGLKSVLSKVDETCMFGNRYKSIFNNDAFKILEDTRDFINDDKHSHTDDLNYDYNKSLNILFAAIQKLFNETYIGFFDRVSMKPFEENEYIGDFVCSHGNGVFTEKLHYNGEKYIHKQYCYLVDIDSGKGLNLFPFMHWQLCSKHKDEDYGHCYFFDKYEGEGLLFSSVNGNCKKIIQKDDSTYSNFNNAIKSFYEDTSFAQLIDIRLIR